MRDERYWLVPNLARLPCRMGACAVPDRQHSFASRQCRPLAVPECIVEVLLAALGASRAELVPASEDAEPFDHASCCPNDTLSVYNSYFRIHYSGDSFSPAHTSSAWLPDQATPRMIWGSDPP